MYQSRRKIIAFVFLLIVATPLFISFKFILEEKIIESEIEEKLQSKTLQTIQAPAASLCWLKNGKEVIVGGEIFDVKTSNMANGIVTLLGFFDAEEKEIEEQFKSLIEDDAGDSPFSKFVIKFLFSPVYSTPSEIICKSNWSYVSKDYYAFDEMIPVAPVLPSIQPPRL